MCVTTSVAVCSKSTPATTFTSKVSKILSKMLPKGFKLRLVSPKINTQPFLGRGDSLLSAAGAERGGSQKLRTQKTQ